MNLIIRPLKTAEDGRYLEQIVIAAWGSDALDSIPGHLSLTVAKENGGVILLAFDEDQDNRPIGFCWGFWAYIEEEKKWKCASHMAGVIPEYKGQGVGEKIKWAQRKFTLEKGFDLMTWTYDPLETMNGSLNIRKLGGVCNRYYENLYGDLDDELNRGIPTDRFGVDWWLASNWAETHEDQSRPLPTVESLLADGGRFLNQTSLKNDLLTPCDSDSTAVFSAEPRYLLLQVPRRFQSVKKADLQTGLAWRLHTRELFSAAFNHGYTIIDLIPGDPVCHYIFEKNWNYL
ncbi:MAG: putative GNAT superfamily acetyltransferase [Cellvibrionaceae bacterium]|jgi:predicted GNAT superfamily acetyltransferase